MKQGIWVVCLLFLLPFVAAQAPESSFFVDVTPTEASILLNETAYFAITIQNSLAQTEQFRLYSPDVEWDIQYMPAADRIVSIPPGGSKTVQVHIRPLYVTPGVYGVNINVKSSRTNELQKSVLFLSVTSHENINSYLPSIYGKINLPETIDPREEYTLELALENRNRKTLGNVDLRVRSELFQYDDVVSFSPLEEKTLTIPFSIPDTTLPQEDTITATLIYTEDGKTYQFDARPATISIQGYGGVEEHVETTKSFFKYVDTITLDNKGNARKTYVYMVPTSFLKNLFTSTDPLGGVYDKKGGKSVIKFTTLLEPGETKTIVVTKNYRPIIWTVLVLLVLILLYQYYKSPVVLTKVSRVIATQEGGASELKVLVTVRNRGPKTMQDILIMDKIPSMAQIVREFDVGTLEPSSILKNEQKGTLLKWQLERLDKFEERIISYRIKTRLAVLGSIQLPPAVAKYRTVQGKEKVVTSSVKFFQE